MQTTPQEPAAAGASTAGPAQPGWHPAGERQHRQFPDGSRRPSFTQQMWSQAASADGVVQAINLSTRHGFLGPDGKTEVEHPHCDSHMHPTDYVQHGLMPEKVIAMMNEIGVRNTTLMPIPTSLQVVKVSANAERGATSVTRAEPGSSDAVTGTVITTSFHPSHGATASCRDHNHHCAAQSYYIPAKLMDDIKAETGKSLDADLLRDRPDLIQRIVDHSILFVDTAVNGFLHQQIANAVQAGRLTQADRSRLDPMLTGFNLGDMRAGERLIKELCNHQGTFTGIGEITVHKELVQLMYADQKGQASVLEPPAEQAGEPDANEVARLEGLKNLLEMAGVVGMPVVLHCDIDDLRAQVTRPLDAISDDKPKHFEGLKKLFKDERLKDTKIIWAHGGGLGRFVMQGKDHLTDLKALLAECPNLHLDISWSAVAQQITTGGRFANRAREWVQFLESHSDRICFGSDTLAPKTAQGWAQTSKMYKGVMAQLSPGAAENLRNGTYEKLFVAARENIRELERTVFTHAFEDKFLMDSNRAESILSADEVRTAIKQAQQDQREFATPRASGSRALERQLRVQQSAPQAQPS